MEHGASRLSGEIEEERQMMGVGVGVSNVLSCTCLALVFLFFSFFFNFCLGFLDDGLDQLDGRSGQPQT